VLSVGADNKINVLQKIVKQGGPLIRFTTDTYKDLVLEGGRDYSVFVFFTTSSPKFKCAVCIASAKDLAALGVSYEKHFGGDYTSEAFLQKPFFIGYLEFDDGQEIFQMYKFQTVPHFVYIGPGAKRTESISEENTMRVPEPSAEVMANFVASKVGVDIPIYKSPYPYYVAIMLVLFLIVLINRVFSSFMNRLRDPILWFVLAVGGYWIVMAGITYDVLRKPPWSEVHNSGLTMYISPHSRTQFVAEGFIVATLLTTTGLIFVIFGDVLPRVKSTTKQFIGFCAACASLFMCLTLINNIFAMKYHMPAFHLRGLLSLHW